MDYIREIRNFININRETDKQYSVTGNIKQQTYSKQLSKAAARFAFDPELKWKAHEHTVECATKKVAWKVGIGGNSVEGGWC